MKIAIYPGSFNPWHEGHEAVLDIALTMFDKVIVAQGINPNKPKPEYPRVEGTNLECVSFEGLLVDYINRQPEHISAVIKGLRNAQDFEYEKIQQYWNEDLGIIVPTVYIIANRSLVHISSSAIRTVEILKGNI